MTIRKGGRWRVGEKVTKSQAIKISTTSPDSSLQKQIAICFQADASLQETLKGITLPVEAVDHLSSLIKQVRE